MSQTSNPSEPSTNAGPAAGEPADFPEIRPAQDVKTDNLAFTNPDEYKHKHGEHKDGEHKHHHHHHHHHHRHFHLFNISISGIRDNLKLLFTSVYTYPYMLLFLSLVFLFVMKAGIVRSLVNSHSGAFSTMENFYRWQEFLVMKEAFLIRLPFQFTLLVSVGILLFLMQQQERHWQRNVMKLLPALGAAAIFSFPVGSRPAELSARSACRDSLRNYHVICIEYADLNDGAFPNELPEKPSAGSRYGADHYIYHGAGKSAKDEAFILLEDKDGSHIGNYRYAIRSDGVMLVSTYGRLYQEYSNPNQSAAKAE